MANKYIHVTLNPKKDEDIIGYLNGKNTTEIVKSLIRFSIEHDLKFKTIVTMEK